MSAQTHTSHPHPHPDRLRVHIPFTASHANNPLFSVQSLLQPLHSRPAGSHRNPTPTPFKFQPVLHGTARHNHSSFLHRPLPAPPRKSRRSRPVLPEIRYFSPTARALTSMLTDPLRKTATVVAASSANSTSVFQALLDAGWDINSSLGHIGDALSLAVGCDKVPLVQWHLAHGADPNANLRGETHTALELGAIHAGIETLDLLLDHGARMQNTSALKLAAHYGRVEVVAFLLDRGAAVDEIPDNENIYEAERERGLGNALHAAAREGKGDVVALLLDRGADPKIKDSRGWLALDLARSGGHASVVGMLEGRSC